MCVCVWSVCVCVWSVYCVCVYDGFNPKPSKSYIANCDAPNCDGIVSNGLNYDSFSPKPSN